MAGFLPDSQLILILLLLNYDTDEGDDRTRKNRSIPCRVVTSILLTCLIVKMECIKIEQKLLGSSTGCNNYKEFNQSMVEDVTNGFKNRDCLNYIEGQENDAPGISINNDVSERLEIECILIKQEPHDEENLQSTSEDITKFHNICTGCPVAEEWDHVVDRDIKTESSNTSFGLDASKYLEQNWKVPKKKRIKTCSDLVTNKRKSKSNTINEKLRPHICIVCGKSFKDKNYFNLHMKIHAGSKQMHTCTICNKKFGVASSLKKHMLIHSGIRSHKCELCGKDFGQPGHLKSHMIMHSGIKAHKCEICGKEFSLPTHLKTHSVIHSVVKPYHCELCTKVFSLPSHLKTHMISHSGVKPYKCTLCDKVFGRPDNLKVHMLTHSGFKRHKCKLCIKEFSQLAHLKSHMVTHSGVKSHKCTVCDKVYGRVDNLKTHMLTHVKAEIILS